jgi:hypothetical protein
MKPVGVYCVLYMLEAQIREEPQTVAILFNGETCLKMLDGLAQITAKKMIGLDH